MPYREQNSARAAMFAASTGCLSSMTGMSRSPSRTFHFWSAIWPTVTSSSVGGTPFHRQSRGSPSSRPSARSSMSTPSEDRDRVDRDPRAGRQADGGDDAHELRAALLRAGFGEVLEEQAVQEGKPHRRDSDGMDGVHDALAVGRHGL